ncbi:hypothetical protein KQI42_05130 [Tissierella sp. MSJ-40]|uniref:Uncharacterized protein n=1 Tax=Tissierella simiarum TaxID=2841534 RepID=A0ABS6E3H8_9FIRM|nr:DUF6648 family protein [Tissierella simiarum]MBU5437381.1 hypothetical protein [Tissierella simiarum]
MNSYKKRGMFETFFDNRSSLIVQFKNGDITKKEFLEYNFDFVQKMNVKPFLKVDSYEKGMYNYQYYNVLAKYYTMLAKDVKKTKKHQKYYPYYLNKGNNYYHEKDRATLNLLRYLEFQNVEAYFIKVQSRFLQDKLYEIVLLDYKEAIFHSKAIWLLNVLKEEGVFKEGKKVSLIDEYINEKY